MYQRKCNFLQTQYSKPSMTRTPMARLSWLIRPRFLVPGKFFLAQEKYFWEFSYFITKKYVVFTH